MHIQSKDKSYRLGVDTGGTFTDVTLVNDTDGNRGIAKVPSTPNNPAEAVMNGVDKIINQENIEAKDIGLFLHGTTVATNTLIEKTGAKTLLITTEGFRDVLEIGRQTRPSLYDFRKQKPKPLVPRQDRLEVSERIRHTGEILSSLKEKSITDVLQKIEDAAPDVIAICLLNSYANSEHEHELKIHLKKRFPHLYVTLSSDVLPEMKEFERTSTVVANAYVMPVMDTYLSKLEKELKVKKISSDLYVMQSNGGVIAANESREVPVRTSLSGPVGGVMAGKRAGRETNHDHIITLDMGGTSLDICLIENGEAFTTTESEVAGQPLKLPMLDIHTIGAGGGSIAWVDEGGALKVGPRSAGAVPGPVCYGNEGKQPTVTDAHAVLGRLNPDGILGGDMALDIESAHDVIKKEVATPLDISVEQAALGMLQVVNTNMMRGIRVVSVERGRDPRNFSMVGFGGAGPLHIADLANLLRVETVIIPPSPGITSAVGMIMSDVRHDDVRTFFHRADQADLNHLQGFFQEMEEPLRKLLTREGFDKEEQVLEYMADFRYQNQSYEIQIPLSSSQPSSDQWNKAIADFHNAHAKLYGYSREEEVVEVVHVRTIASGEMPDVQEVKLQKREVGHAKPASSRQVFWEDRWIETPIFNRTDLYAGDEITGPAIIEQLDSTITIPPENLISVDTHGNCLMKANKETGGGNK